MIWNDAAIARDSLAAASTTSRPLAGGERGAERDWDRSKGDDKVEGTAAAATFVASLLRCRITGMRGDREREEDVVGISGEWSGGGEDKSPSDKSEGSDCAGGDRAGECGVDRLSSAVTGACTIDSKSSRIEMGGSGRRREGKAD